MRIGTVAILLAPTFDYLLTPFGYGNKGFEFINTGWIFAIIHLILVYPAVLLINDLRALGQFNTDIQ